MNFAREVLGPLRQSLVRDALRALEFGWVGFEKIWRDSEWAKDFDAAQAVALGLHGDFGG